MKTKLNQIGIYIIKKVLNFIYYFFKLFPVKTNKTLFCSRQSNDIPLDFIMIEEKLKIMMPGTTCVNICCHVGHGFKDYNRYIFYLLKSLYHLATSKVCVLDSYWPAVSILNHRESLKVIQIWHAIGKIKQSGYQTLGKKSGRKEEYAKALNMHKNYDYVIAGAEYWNKYYCASFGITEDKLLNYGLPRIDYLIDTEEKNREKFFKKFPELYGKKIILYAPTFRRNMKSHWEEIVDEVGDDGYILIIKKHPGEYMHIPKCDKNVFYMEEFKTIELIAVCDYYITDYSAGALEAAVLKKRTYYWTYDYDEYVENNGLNIELSKEVSPYIYSDIKELMNNIKNEEYNDAFIEGYRSKFLPKELGHATEKITKLIENILSEKVF